MSGTDDPAPDLAALRGRLAELEAVLASATPDSFLHATFDDMFEGIQVLDAELRYLYLNGTAARHGRRPAPELLGRRMAEVYPGIEHTEVFRLLRRCLEEKAPQRMVNRFDYPDGERAWFDLRISPIPLGVLVLSVDVSEQKRIEESLRRSQDELARTQDAMARAQRMESLGRLAAGVAHDFNNLLTVIYGYSELLGVEPALPGSARAAVEQIRRAAEQAAALTRQLLAFSRQQVLEPRVLDLNAVVRGVGNILARILGEDVSLATVLAPDLGRVRADPGQIEQILLNLAVNARDSMPTGGTLAIETGNLDLEAPVAREGVAMEAGSYVLLATTDSGCGMDAATRARIFEPFFTTKGPGQGTGLGLATVYGIVKQSGGFIWVYSEPGVGSTFKVYLPRIDEAVAAARLAAPAKPQGGEETLLLIEDEEAVRQVVQLSLSSCGYAVLAARDGAEAIALCQAHPGPIHLLVTDVILPGMGGGKAAEALQALRPELKVLYISGYTDDAVVRLGILHGEAAFLQKPFTPGSLARKVREVLGHAA